MEHQQKLNEKYTPFLYCILSFETFVVYANMVPYCLKFIMARHAIMSMT